MSPEAFIGGCYRSTGHQSHYSVTVSTFLAKVELVYGACWTSPRLPLVTYPVCGCHGQNIEA